MALGERIALSRYQSGTESSPGTAVAATRIELVEPGAWLKPTQEVAKPNEMRSSYIRNYRSFITKQAYEITGMQWWPTFERLPVYMQAGAKGGATATSDGGTPAAYPYPFTPTAASNDLKHFTWEAIGETQVFICSGGVLNRFEFGATADGPMTGSMDWLFLNASESTATAGLSDPTVEDINAATGIFYIDSTTVGSTAAAYATSWKFAVDNKYSQLYVFNGNLYAKENYRGEARMATIDATLAFDTITEYNKFLNSGRGERKLRMDISGTVIHDAVKKNLQVDWYGYWDAFDFGSDNGLRTAQLKGESHYDTSATFDWKILCTNALSVLP
jgi:hypothetical protein